MTKIKEYSQTQQYSRREKDKTNSCLSHYEYEHENVKCKKTIKEEKVHVFKHHTKHDTQLLINIAITK